jgi:hypothetical protein
MPASVTIQRIEREGRKFHVYFSDGTAHEFANRRQARAAVEAALDDSKAVDLLKTVAVAKALRATQGDDDPDELDALIGKAISINLNAAQNIVRIV